MKLRGVGCWDDAGKGVQGYGVELGEAISESMLANVSGKLVPPHQHLSMLIPDVCIRHHTVPLLASVRVMGAREVHHIQREALGRHWGANPS